MVTGDNLLLVLFLNNKANYIDKTLKDASLKKMFLHFILVIVHLSIFLIKIFLVALL